MSEMVYFQYYTIYSQKSICLTMGLPRENYVGSEMNKTMAKSVQPQVKSRKSEVTAESKWYKFLIYSTLSYTYIFRYSKMNKFTTKQIPYLVSIIIMKSMALKADGIFSRSILKI